MEVSLIASAFLIHIVPAYHAANGLELKEANIE